MTMLPPGWCYCTLGQIVENLQNGCGTRSSKEGIATVVLRLADVSSEEGRISNEGLREIHLKEAETIKYKLKPGDLLAYRVNGSRSIAGRVVPYTGPDGYAFCDHFIRIRLFHQINPNFIAYAFRTRDLRSRVEQELVSSAGQHTISQETLSQLNIKLPPAPEQHRIVSKLESLLAPNA